MKKLLIKSTGIKTLYKVNIELVDEKDQSF